MLELAAIAGRRGDAAEQARWLENAVAAQPTLVRPRRALVLLYLADQEAEKALAAALPALALNPDDIEMLGLVGEAQLQSSRSAEAISIFERIIRAAPNVPAWHFSLAKAFGLAGNHDRMRSEIERALELDPGHLPSQVALVRLLMLGGDLVSAEARFETAKSAHPDAVEVVALQGWMFLQQGRAQEAIEPLQAAFDRSDPWLGRDVVGDLARAYWEVGDRDGSVATLERWLLDNPRDIAMLLAAGQAYTQLGRLDSAQATYRRI